MLKVNKNVFYRIQSFYRRLSRQVFYPDHASIKLTTTIEQAQVEKDSHNTDTAPHVRQPISVLTFCLYPQVRTTPRS